MKKDVFDKYVNLVAKKYHVNKDEIFSKTKKSDVVDARQAIYYLCYNRPMHINFIRRCMEQNGYETAHTTILRGIYAMEQKMSEDIDYREMIDKIQNGFSLTI